MRNTTLLCVPRTLSNKFSLHCLHLPPLYHPNLYFGTLPLSDDIMETPSCLDCFPIAHIFFQKLQGDYPRREFTPYVWEAQDALPWGHRKLISKVSKTSVAEFSGCLIK